MATYDAYAISSYAGGVASFTVGSSLGTNVSLTDDDQPGDDSVNIGGNVEQLLGWGTANGGDLNFPNLVYTDGSGALDVAGQMFQYVGLATSGGTTGFVAQVITWDGANPNSGVATSSYVFFVLNGDAVGAGGGVTIAPANTATPGSGDGFWNMFTNAPDASCFLADTMVSTPDGAVAVQDLKAGDLVLTASGAAVPVRWLGRSTVATAFADAARVLPIRIKAGALGDNLPVRDLLISPAHALVLNGTLVHASALVNGSSIVRETRADALFNYYHVEVDHHDVILVEGVHAETFAGGVEEMRFDNAAERPAALADAKELAMPRVKSARQLPEAVRATIAARAAVIAPGVAIAA